MIRYEIIADDEDLIKINVGIDEKGKSFMPSVEFGKFDIYWDNEDFIFNEFYNLLKEIKDNPDFSVVESKKFSEETLEDIKFLFNIICENCSEIIEMLDKAIELGWYNKIVYESH